MPPLEVKYIKNKTIFLNLRKVSKVLQRSEL